MTTLPHTLLSEQEIIDIARKCDSPAADQSQTTAFAHAIESALLAKLAEGVELEPFGYLTAGFSFRQLEDLCESRPATAVVTLSTAQAAVAAERWKLEAAQTHAYAEGRTDQHESDSETLKAAIALLRDNLKDVNECGDGFIGTTRVEELLDGWFHLQKPKTDCQPDECRDKMCDVAGCRVVFNPKTTAVYECRWPACSGDCGTEESPPCKAEHYSQASPSSAPAAEPANNLSRIYEFQELCKLLPEGTSWGDGLTPAIVKHIVSATPSPLPAATDLAHELWSAAQLAPGEGIEDGVRRIAALLPAAAGMEDRAGLVDGLVEQFLANHFFGVYHCTRVWDAWNVGTLDQGDFEPAGDSGMPRELAQEAVDFILDRLASSAAQVPEDARDAARYRWLRDKSATAAQSTPTVLARFPLCDEDHSMLGGLDLDEAIDLLLLGAAAPAAGGEHG